MGSPLTSRPVPYEQQLGLGVQARGMHSMHGMRPRRPPGGPSSPHVPKTDGTCIVDCVTLFPIPTAMAKGKGRRQPNGQPGGKSEFRKDDIYEADDVEAPEDRHANRFDVSMQRAHRAPPVLQMAIMGLLLGMHDAGWPACSLGTAVDRRPWAPPGLAHAESGQLRV